MSFQTDMFPFTVPLTATNHQIAEKFYQQHSAPQKAKQIYLNTLSVLAVNFYLSCLGIKTTLERSQSWDPALQVLVDTADLWVDDLGYLECRAVLPAAKACTIPPPVWTDRIGYIIVQLSEDLTEASLLGFVQSVEVESLPLDQLQPLDLFPEYLNSLAAIATQLPKGVITPATTTPAVIKLNQWLHNQVTEGWQTLEALLEWQGQPTLSFRTPTTRLPEEASFCVTRGRVLAIGTPKVQVLFLIEITPRTALEYQIKLELYPVGADAYLPKLLHLSVMDEAGKTVLQAENSNSEGLEFQFAGEIGERFSVSIRLQEDNLIETFEI